MLTWLPALLLACLLSRPSTAPAQPQPAFEVKTRGLELELSADGRIVKAVLAGKAEMLTGQTVVAMCEPEGPVIALRTEAGGIQFTKTLRHTASGQRCVLTQRFEPTHDSVRWEIELRSPDRPWSTAIETSLHYPATAQSRLWTCWGNPEPTQAGWQDPLVWRPFADRAWPYQYNSFEDPAKARCICIPLVTVAEPSRDAALSWALSPEDRLLGLALSASSQGELVFTRTHYRLGDNRPIRFAMDLVAHAADWRGGLGWMVKRYPEYFDPPNPAADEMAGCGAYSGSEEHFDTAKLRAMAFRINWKCSEDFPYMGMFLPPLADPQARWERAPDEQTPGKPAWTSFQILNDYSHWMRANGFRVLNYFNVTEYGRNMQYPPPPRAIERLADLWKNPHDYLFQSDRRTAVLMRGGQPLRSNCYGALIVDPGDSAYQQHLLEQARRQRERLPDSDGLCIDRTDWLNCYNTNADDQVSWFEGHQARSLFLSWRDLMTRLGPEMHRAGKVIFINDCTARLEVLRHVDGIYAEWTWPGSEGYFNYSALLGVRKPVMVWTPDESALKANGPDAYFQRCLYLGLFPTAPYPLNNHCIRPSPWVDEQYLAYGPLLEALRGKKWVLLPHAIEAAGGQAKVNLFQVPGGYVAPVVFAGQADTVPVILCGLKDVNSKTACEVLHPGEAQSERVGLQRAGHGFRLQIPVRRGCALVRILRPKN